MTQKNKPTPTGGSVSRQRLLNSFDIDYYSEADGQRYEGRFTSKKLSIRDLAALGVRKSQLNGGMHYDPAHPGHGVDEQTDEFNNMIAHLEISIKEAPVWWNLDEITDISLIGRIYREVILFENTFLGRGREAGSGGSSEGDSTSGTAEANTDGAAVAVVEQEVPASLQP